MKSLDVVEVTIGGVKMRVEPTAAGGPKGTESLARELVRGILGTGASPSLEVTRGPASGTKRELPPPEVTWVIGRGDGATWVILDEDLSREHVEITRGWEGVTLRDLGSKNGTRVDGARITGQVPLRDGAEIEAGNTAWVFRDPAERHLDGVLVSSGPRPVVTDEPEPVVVIAPPRPAPIVFWIASSICALACLGLLWVLAS